tara:strand:+ start:26394 stop:26642 length:249 start_codon:yes stop_codon:yes gene_type:complete
MLTTNQVDAHAGHLNEKAITVCTDKVRSDACQYEGGHDDLFIGTCQYMVETLMCVRNQPIQKIDALQSIKATEFKQKAIDNN